jgi:DNA adenine methylase
MGEYSLMEYYSPLRYPGGKSQLSTFFKQVYKTNYLYDGVYVEPYAGGASIALSLLFNEYASKIIINDLDKAVFAFWYSVINFTEDLCKLIKDTPVNIPNWKKQKIIQKTINADFLSLGFSTFFLNRTNRSGILNAGVIGGLDQTGEWKIDARYNKDDLINRIQKVALFKTRIEIHNLDAVALLRKIKNRLPAKSLLYLDPPYYIKGKDLYLNFYNDANHRSVCDEIGKITNHKWILTYDNVLFIRQLYDNHRQIKYSLNYSASKAYKGNEVVIFSDNLFVPKYLELQSAEVVRQPNKILKRK